MLASVGTMFRAPVGLGRGNGTAARVAMKGNKAYHVEVRLLCTHVITVALVTVHWNERLHELAATAGCT